jgi:NitT/TauT family transport system substrate-binding protein
MGLRGSVLALLAAGALCAAGLPATGCARGAEEPPLRVATVLWPGVEPLFLGRELGLLPDPDVRLVEFSNPREAERAFRSGLVDVAFLTLDHTLKLAAAGFAPRVVGVVDVSAGADAILARPSIRSLGELRGKRIAVDEQEVSIYLLHRALQEGGLTLRDVELVRAPLEELAGAYRRGEVDAVVTFEPTTTQVLRAGAQRLFDSSRISGEILDVMVVHGRVLEEQPGRLRTLLEGWFEALTYVEREPTDAVRRMSVREALSPGDFARALGGVRLAGLEANASLLGADPPGLLALAERVQQAMGAAGLLPRQMPLEGLLAPGPLAAVAEAEARASRPASPSLPGGRGAGEAGPP